MPKDNSLLPSDNNQQQTTTPPPVLEDVVLPPMVGDKPLAAAEKQTPTNSGSAAPNDDIVMQSQPISSNPRKKFAGGKVIATILGLFLLVGGLGAGVVLVGQNQNIEEQAGCYNTCMIQVGDTDECNNACGTDNTGGVGGGTVTNCGPCGVKANGQCKICDDDPGPKEPYCSTSMQQCQFGCNADSNGGSCKSDPNPPVVCSDQQAAMGSCPRPATGNGCRTTGCPSTHYCHCQGGVSCEYGACVPKGYFDTACTGDGRYVAINPIGGSSTYTCCEAGYVPGPNQIGCVAAPTTGGGGTPSNPPASTPTAPPVITASCQNIKTYKTSDWSMIPTTSLSSLKGGQDSVYFCVSGSLTGGSFDKAKFTINGTLQPETTTVRPNSPDFCQLYNLPTGVTSYNVTAEIHHVTLGWK